MAVPGTARGDGRGLLMGERLAIDGGTPVRQTLLPYGRQSIEETDVQAVAETLRSDWLTTGPKVEEFEAAFAVEAGARHAVAVCNGTAALHAAMFAVGVGPGDDVIVPPLSFAATANCALYQGATPVFADVNAETLLIDPEAVAARVTPHTKAIIAVDYAGQPCDYDALRAIAERHGIAIVADACHALGATYKGRRVGSLADLSTFSLHPVKPMTTGEGGVITTDDATLAERMRTFRNHGITTDARARQHTWLYEMTELGFNYRLTDIQCALGLSQLPRVKEWLRIRQGIAVEYGNAFADLPELTLLSVRDDVLHGYHLFVVQLELERLAVDRAAVFAALRAEGIGVQVHYMPIYYHPYYVARFGELRGRCPVAEAAYEQIVTLPLFPSMSERDVLDVIAAVGKVMAAYAR